MNDEISDTALFLDIDEKLDKRDLHLVKISDDGAGDEYGIQDLPSLVYFENGVPEIFEGDIRNDNQIIKWMLEELKQEEIKDVSVAMLNRLIDRNHNLAVVFMDEESKEGNFLFIKKNLIFRKDSFYSIQSITFKC